MTRLRLSLVLVLSGCSLLSDGPPSDAKVEVGRTPQVITRPILPFTLGGTTDPVPKPVVGPGQCRMIDGGGPTRDGCVTDEIRCGDTVIGATRGGVQRYDTAFYRRNFCWPDTVSHDGGDERVYKLKLPPGDMRVVLTLDTPCADLDVAAMWLNGDTCPSPDSVLPRCEMARSDGTTRERVEFASQRGGDWWVVVEGKGPDEGVFGLSVQCFDGLH